MAQDLVKEKLAKTGPRKLLALDSGGIRGVISIEVLAELERTLRQLLNQGDDFVLADYFDYIGGMSAGAIIAACLSLGMSVDQIRTFFFDSSRAMFQKARPWQRWRYKFQCAELKRKIKDVIADIPGPEEDVPDLKDSLGSNKLRTLLLLVMRNATTDSPWPLSNNPYAKFNTCLNDPTCNLKLPLWQLIRASAAAPSFFAPETIRLGSKLYVFDDGAMTPFGNPAFQLFLMATLAPYNLGWPTGEDQMLLVSVGTGSAANTKPKLGPLGEHLLSLAQSVPAVLIGASATQNDVLCRVFGKCLVGDPIDSELDDLIDRNRSAVDPQASKLFTYLRYDADLTTEGLSKAGLGHIHAADVRKLDSVAHVSELQEIGKAVSQKVAAHHFKSFSAPLEEAHTGAAYQAESMR